MDRKVVTIVSIILFIVSIISIVAVGIHFDLFDNPNKTYVVLMIVSPLVQLSMVFIARFKK